jgi:5-methylcytosine-specific restriction endonuclease McrA
MRSDMKTCTKCGETKELTEFHRNKQSKDGRRPNCKVCARAQVKQIEDGKREELREYHRKYREKNKDKIREHGCKYYQNNKDRIKKYRKENRDKLRTYSARRRDVTLSSEWRRIISRMPCYYCGTSDTSLKYHVDHRVPVAKGGDDSWVNLVRACEPCNFSKSAKTDAEFFGWR